MERVISVMSKMKIVPLIVLMLTFSFTTGCATAPDFSMQGVLTHVTPKQVAEQIALYKEKRILMGGIIVNSTTVKTGTQLEILAYPLDSNHKPLTEELTIGRFIAMSPHYLETVDYAPGKQLSLIGNVTGSEQGKIGETDFTYPVISITQIHLWAGGYDNDVDTRVHFGIGIVFH